MPIDASIYGAGRETLGSILDASQRNAVARRQAATNEQEARSLGAYRQQQIAESQEQQRTKAEAAAKAQQEQAAAQQVFQQYGDDPDQLIVHLRAGAPNIASAYEKQQAENRKSAAEAADKELTNTEKRNSIGADIWRRGAASKDPAIMRALYIAGRPFMVDNHELPEPDQITPELLGQLIEGTQKYKEVADEHRAALNDLKEGKWLEGISRGLLVSDSPEDRKGFLGYAASQGAPRALLEMLSTKSPEELKAATMTPNEQAANANAAAQTAVNARTVGVAERNVGVRNQPAATTGASGSKADADRQRLVAAVIANPEIYSGLTPSAQTAIAADLAEKGFKGFAKGAAAKPATGAQMKVLGFFNRAKQADEDLQKLEPEIEKMGLLDQTRMNHAWNMFQSQTGQAYNQAQRAFTEARLRKDSGAAIPENEFTSDKQTYFPQPGDSATTLRQKARARASMLASFAFESGPALAGFYGDDAESMMADFKSRAKGTQPAGGGTQNAPAGKDRVIGPNGETGTVPAGTALPPGWRKQ